MLINATYLGHNLYVELSRFEDDYIVTINDEKRQRYYQAFNNFREACNFKKRFINEFNNQVDVELVLIETINSLKEDKQKK